MDVMYHLYEVLRLVSIMITPVMEDSAKTIQEELGLNKEEVEFTALEFGRDTENTVIEKPLVLFKRLNMQEELPTVDTILVYNTKYLTTAPQKFIKDYIDNMHCGNCCWFFDLLFLNCVYLK